MNIIPNMLTLSIEASQRYLYDPFADACDGDEVTFSVSGTGCDRGTISKLTTMRECGGLLQHRAMREYMAKGCPFEQARMYASFDVACDVDCLLETLA